jgi:hypothetical protein
MLLLLLLLLLFFPSTSLILRATQTVFMGHRLLSLMLLLPLIYIYIYMYIYTCARMEFHSALESLVNKICFCLTSDTHRGTRALSDPWK